MSPAIANNDRWQLLVNPGDYCGEYFQWSPIIAYNLWWRLSAIVPASPRDYLISNHKSDTKHKSSAVKNADLKAAQLKFNSAKSSGRKSSCKKFGGAWKMSRHGECGMEDIPQYHSNGARFCCRSSQGHSGTSKARPKCGDSSCQRTIIKCGQYHT